MADEAVLDSPVLEMEDAGVAEPQADEVVADDAVVTDAIVAPEGTSEVDWRKVPASLKEFFKTPEGKPAKDAWFERMAWKNEMPEGVQGLKEIKAFLDEHGGRDGLSTTLTEMQTKAQELDGIQQSVSEGKRDVIDNWAANAPDGFAKLAPVVNEQWSKVDPEGWAASMSGVMAATISNAGIPAFLERMEMLLEFGKTEQVAASIKQLLGWTGSFAEKASAPRINQQAAKPAEADAARSELQTLKTQTYERELTSDVESTRTSAIEGQLKTFVDGFRGAKEDLAEKKQLALDSIRTQVLTQMNGDQKFKDAIKAFNQRMDKAGAAKLIASRERAVIETIAPKVGRLIFGQPGPAKVTPIAAVKPKPVDLTKTKTKEDKFDAIWANA